MKIKRMKMKIKMKTQTINRFKRKIIMLTVTLISLAATSSSASIIGFDDQYAVDGDKITFTVFVQNAANEVDSLGFEVGYDATVLSYSGYVPGELVYGFTNFSANNVDFGRVRIGGFDIGDHAILPGTSGPLVKLTFNRVERKDCKLTFFNLIDDLKGWETQGLTYINETTDTNDEDSTDSDHTISNGSTGNENTPDPETIKAVGRPAGSDSVEETANTEGIARPAGNNESVQNKTPVPAANESYPAPAVQRMDRTVSTNNANRPAAKTPAGSSESQMEISVKAGDPETALQSRGAQQKTKEESDESAPMKETVDMQAGRPVMELETETKVKELQIVDEEKSVSTNPQSSNNAAVLIMIGVALVQMLILVIQVYSLKKINGLARFIKGMKGGGVQQK